MVSGLVLYLHTKLVLLLVNDVYYTHCAVFTVRPNYLLNAPVYTYMHHVIIVDVFVLGAVCI